MVLVVTLREWNKRDKELFSRKPRFPFQGTLAAGIIHSSSSSACTGVFFLEKDKTVQLYTNSHGLNDITVKNCYTSSRGLCLHQAWPPQCLLVWIMEGDEWKTASNTPSGDYEYLLMPIRLSNTPAIFQSVVNVVFHMSLCLCTWMMFLLSPRLKRNMWATPSVASLRLTPRKSTSWWICFLANFYCWVIRTYSQVVGPLRGIDLVVQHKLTPRFVGPFLVSEVINPATVWLHIPSSMRVLAGSQKNYSTNFSGTWC